jgi:hypothetical protein
VGRASVPIGVALLLAGLLALAGGAVGMAGPAGPTPAGGTPPPGPLLPDLAVTPAEQLLVETDSATGRRTLRFSTTIANVGAGPMELLGQPDPARGTVAIRQRLARAPDGGTREVGTFVFDAAHGHWHVDELVVTELWSLGPDGTPAALVAATGKTSFCLVDAWLLEPPPTGATRFAEFLVCVPDRQGLSPGWADRYDATLPGQDLDVTGLPDGRYALRSAIDPAGLLTDADPANNALTVGIELVGNAVGRVDLTATPDAGG